MKEPTKQELQAWADMARKVTFDGDQAWLRVTEWMVLAKIEPTKDNLYSIGQRAAALSRFLKCPVYKSHPKGSLRGQKSTYNARLLMVVSV